MYVSYYYVKFRTDFYLFVVFYCILYLFLASSSKSHSKPYRFCEKANKKVEESMVLQLF